MGRKTEKMEKRMAGKIRIRKKRILRKGRTIETQRKSNFPRLLILNRIFTKFRGERLRQRKRKRSLAEKIKRRRIRIEKTRRKRTIRIVKIITTKITRDRV